MIKIEMTFSTIAEAAAALASFPRFDSETARTAIPTTKDTAAEKPKATPKSAKTAEPADTKATAVETVKPKVDDVPATPKIEYAPLGAKIAELVAAGKAAQLKALFPSLKHKDGSTGVKKGSEVHDDDLAALAAGLAAIEGAADESMT